MIRSPALRQDSRIGQNCSKAAIRVEVLEVLQLPRRTQRTLVAASGRLARWRKSSSLLIMRCVLARQHICRLPRRMLLLNPPLAHAGNRNLAFAGGAHALAANTWTATTLARFDRNSMKTFPIHMAAFPILKYAAFR